MDYINYPNLYNPEDNTRAHPLSPSVSWYGQLFSGAEKKEPSNPKGQIHSFSLSVFLNFRSNICYVLCVYIAGIPSLYPLD